MLLLYTQFMYTIYIKEVIEWSDLFGSMRLGYVPPPWKYILINWFVGLKVFISCFMEVMTIFHSLVQKKILLTHTHQLQSAAQV